MTKILGIDPGLERVGFGLIERDAHQRYFARDWGVITTHKRESDSARLAGIYKTLKDVIASCQPDQAAVEKLFFFRNATTMVPVCQARGVILVALYEAGIPIAEYTPMQVKLNVTGDGRADKKMVQTMVQQILGMDQIPKPDDAADALAIALSLAFEQGPVSLFSMR